MLTRPAGVLSLVLLAAALPPLTPLPRRVDPLTRMPFVLVPPGSFQMGTPPAERDREAQELLHAVAIPHAFYLATHEMTQAEWWTVTDGRPSAHAGCDACPVERITYHDVERMLGR